MSMYTHLLDAAFQDRKVSVVEPTTSEALVTLLHCRDRLDSCDTRDWASTALADQIAYDIALIELSRSIGIDCTTRTFDQPERRRVELQRELECRGVRLGRYMEERPRGGLGLGTRAIDPR